MKTFDAVLLRSELDSKIAEVSELRALVGELADALAKEGHLQGCNTYMCWHEKHDPECCDCGADDLLFRAEEARKP